VTARPLAFVRPAALVCCQKGSGCAAAGVCTAGGAHSAGLVAAGVCMAGGSSAFTGGGAGMGDDYMLGASHRRWRARRRVFGMRKGPGMLPPAFVRRHVWGV